MAIRGERFFVDLSDDDEEVEQKLPTSFDFVGDVQERAPSAPAPPAPPQPSTSSTGFPAHKKRSKESAFKRRRAGKESSPNVSTANEINSSSKESIKQNEKESIDEENKQRLASMTPAQLKDEREELMSSLPSSLLERFLRRANIDEDSHANSLRTDDELPSKSTPENTTKPKKSVTFEIPPQENQHPQVQVEEENEKEDSGEAPIPLQHPSDLDSRAPEQPPELFPASQPPTGSIHFPRPPPRDSPVPNLDPSSETFLSDLQTHYFPDTPHDPSSLSWMQPSTSSSTDASSDHTSAYHPESTATSVAPASLRFSLVGNLLAPRTSLSLPTTLGLHHHASDPEAAGYTIPELATLSRSTVPAQRCLAWQVLGRFLFRLGKDEFGERGSELVEGLWSTVEREDVVAGMLAEAGDSGSNDGNVNPGKFGRHASAKAWATEAVWLWRKGCGGDRGLSKEGVYRSK